VAEFLGIPLERTVKSIVLATDSDAGAQIWLLLIRGDHELNEVKASKVPGLADFRFATEPKSSIPSARLRATSVRSVRRSRSRWWRIAPSPT
jgi:prolyl-tRNA synthetase